MPPGYGRHRPEATLLYQLVEQHYPAFRDLRAQVGRPLPDYVQKAFEVYLKCGRLEEGFLRLRCERCHAEKLVAFRCKKRGFCPSCGARRMAETAALPMFRDVAAPGANDLQGLVEQIAASVGQMLEKRGLIERDIENAWLAAGAEPGPLDDLIGHSISYWIAVGPKAGQKLFTLQAVSPRPQGLEGDANGAARAGGFSLQAGVDIAAEQRGNEIKIIAGIEEPQVIARIFSHLERKAPDQTELPVRARAPPVQSSLL